MEFPVVPRLVEDRATLPLAPGEFHPSAVEGRLCSGGDHRSFGDGNAGVQCESLALLLFARVDSKGECRVDPGVEFGHVVVDFW